LVGWIEALHATAIKATEHAIEASSGFQTKETTTEASDLFSDGYSQCIVILINGLLLN